MFDKVKVLFSYLKKRKKVSALIAALFAAAYLALGLVGQPTEKVEGAQDKCNAFGKLVGLDCGEPPAGFPLRHDAPIG